MEEDVEPLGTGVAAADGEAEGAAAALPDGAAAAAEGDAEAGGAEAGEPSDGDGAPDARMVCVPGAADAVEFPEAGVAAEELLLELPALLDPLAPGAGIWGSFGH